MSISSISFALMPILEVVMTVVVVTSVVATSVAVTSVVVTAGDVECDNNCFNKDNTWI